MGRNLRLAHLPSMHQVIRFSGYLTDPSTTDADVISALSPFLSPLTIWRNRSALPADWPASDDSVIRDPPPGVAPLWGEGGDVSALTVIGDPQTPWRLLARRGQIAVENVWLYDAQATPWPESSAPMCPSCPTISESVAPPPSPPCRAVGMGVAGVVVGGAAARRRSRG